MRRYSFDGFLIQKDNQALSVCGGESCKVYPERAVLVSQSAIKVTMFTIQQSKYAAASLQAVDAAYETHGNVFIGGRLTGAAEANGVTVKQANDSVAVYYATAADLPTTGMIQEID